MKQESFIVDPRQTTAEEHAEGVRQAQTLFKLNHTMPYTEEYNALVKNLFRDNLGEGGWIMPGPHWRLFRQGEDWP